jgi:hypothetical protein
VADTGYSAAGSPELVVVNVYHVMSIENKTATMCSWWKDLQSQGVSIALPWLKQ